MYKLFLIILLIISCGPDNISDSSPNKIYVHDTVTVTVTDTVNVNIDPFTIGTETYKIKTVGSDGKVASEYAVTTTGEIVSHHPVYKQVHRINGRIHYIRETKSDGSYKSEVLDSIGNVINYTICERIK